MTRQPRSKAERRIPLPPRVAIVRLDDGSVVTVPSLSHGVCDYCHHAVQMADCYCGRTVRDGDGFAEVT